MKAIFQARYGSREDLELREVDKPVAANAAVRIDVLLERDDAPPLGIRSLYPERDFAFAAQIFEKAADHVVLEKGLPPLGGDGEGNGLGVIDLLSGYPEPADWYIGLLMLDPSMRGRGVGKRVLDWIVEFARENAVQRLLVCTLEENPMGRAFWAREGFFHLRTIPPAMIGEKMHRRFEIARLIEGRGST